MKKATITLLALLPLFSFAKSYSTDPGLELSFRLFDRGLPMKEYAMIIFKDGVKLDSFMVKKDCEVFLMLDLNSSYTVSISKPHFKERMILAETKVPAGKEEGEYNYSFDVNMITDTATTEDPLDIPVMMIKYDQVSGSFFLSQPEGITVVTDDDVITDQPTDLPKQDANENSAPKKRSPRTMLIRRNR